MYDPDEGKQDDNNHETADGRVIPIEEMDLRHLWAARAKNLKWLKDEGDPVVRRDLLKWNKKFLAEINRRNGNRRGRA